MNMLNYKTVFYFNSYFSVLLLLLFAYLFCYK